MTYPSVYPTGATLYDPERCWNGYTVFQAKEVGALLIDMNGGEVQLWKMLHGMPNRILPGGYIIGSTGERRTAFGSQDGIDLGAGDPGEAAGEDPAVAVTRLVGRRHPDDLVLEMLFG